MSGRGIGIGGGIAVHLGPSKVVPKKATEPEPTAKDRADMDECAGEAVESTCAAARKAGDLPPVVKAEVLP